MPSNVGPIRPPAVVASTSPRTGARVDLPGATRLRLDDDATHASLRLSVPMDLLRPPIDARDLARVQYVTVALPPGGPTVPARFEVREGRTWLEVSLDGVETGLLLRQRMQLMLADRRPDASNAGGRAHVGHGLTIGFEELELDVTAGHRAMVQRDLHHSRAAVAEAEVALQGLRDGTSGWFGHRALEVELDETRARLALAEAHFADLVRALEPLLVGDPSWVARALDAEVPERAELVRLANAQRASPNDTAAHARFADRVSATHARLAAEDPLADARWLAGLADAANRDPEGLALLRSVRDVDWHRTNLLHQNVELADVRTRAAAALPEALARSLDKLARTRAQLTALEQEALTLRDGPPMLERATPHYAD